jgi:signal transduction histidine kinase
VRVSGITFAIPTYFFIVMTAVTIVVGLMRMLAGTLGVVPNPPLVETAATQAVTLFLILRAFSMGTSSVTGVEAISNGITAFKEPRSTNAGQTLNWMAGILGTTLIHEAEVLEQLALDPDMRLELIETGWQEAERLNRLVGNLLDMTRMEAGAIHLNQQEGDIEDVIGAALARLRRRLYDTRLLPAWTLNGDWFAWI